MVVRGGGGLLEGAPPVGFGGALLVIGAPPVGFGGALLVIGAPGGGGACKNTQMAHVSCKHTVGNRLIISNRSLCYLRHEFINILIVKKYSTSENAYVFYIRYFYPFFKRSRFNEIM